MKNPSEYNKGPMGHILDMRAAMGRLAITTREWCRAFDKGDSEAIDRLSAQVGEALADISEAGESTKL